MRTSGYVNKSELLTDTANTLYEACKFQAIPYCAYYSCMMLMRHILYYKLNKSDKEFGSIVSLSGGKGSHNSLKDEVMQYLRNKIPNDPRLNKFSNGISVLKSLRVKADYKEDTIDIKISKKAIDLASEIISIIKNA